MDTLEHRLPFENSGSGHENVLWHGSHVEEVEIAAHKEGGGHPMWRSGWKMMWSVWEGSVVGSEVRRRKRLVEIEILGLDSEQHSNVVGIPS